MNLKPIIIFVSAFSAIALLAGQRSAFESNAKPMAKSVEPTLPAMPVEEPIFEEPAPPTIMVRFGWDDTNAVASVGYWLMWGTNGLHSYSASNRCSTTTGTLELPYGDNPPRWHLAVTAVGQNGLISAPSQELRIPEYPANRVVLSWPTNSASIQHSTDLRSWSTATNFSGTSLDMPLMPGPHFYRATQTLGIRGYFKEP